MDDAAPAGRRKIQVRLSTLILTFIMAGLGVGILIGNAETRRLRNENARLKRGGGEAVFFHYGGSPDAKLAYRLSREDAEKFFALVKSEPTSRDGEPGGKPYGAFFAGDRAYYWYEDEICGTGDDGGPATWRAPGLTRMFQYLGANGFKPDPERYPDMMRAFADSEGE